METTDTNEIEGVMEIALMKKYVLTMDTRQYIIRKKGALDPNTGRHQYTDSRYFSDVEGLMKGIREIGVRSANIKDFEELSEVIIRSSELIVLVSNQLSTLVSSKEE